MSSGDGEPPRYVETRTELEDAVRALAAATCIGIDTESNSMYRYHEQVCFIQIRGAGLTFLIDTVRLRDIEPLRALLASPSTVKVLHGADYDVVSMHRDFKVRLTPLFDTMIAAQFLAKPAVGLAALCEEYFGVLLDKSLTTHDWGARPVEGRYLDYLVEDVAHLEELRSILARELEDADIAEEANLEFERISQLEWNPRVFDADDFRKIKGSRELRPRDQAVLKALFTVRDTVAREVNLPPYKVINNAALLRLVRRPPPTRDGLRRAQRFPRSVRDRHLELFAEGIAAAQRGDVSVERPPVARRRRRVSHDNRGIDELREWRREMAERTGLPTTVILPNHVLGEMSLQLPRTEAELAALPFFGRNRLRKYGKEILTILGGS